MGTTAIITIVAIALLVLHWRGPNAVWGGATIRVIAGIVTGLITKDWSRVWPFCAIGIFIGTLFEWIGRIASKWHHKQG